MFHKIFNKTMKPQESEKDLEARLVSEIKKRGGMAVKLTSQFQRGLPDRVVLLPFHTITFVELKSSGKTPTLLQYRTHEALRKLGFYVAVVDSSASLDDLLRWLDERMAKMEESKRLRDKAHTDGRE